MAIRSSEKRPDPSEFSLLKSTDSESQSLDEEHCPFATPKTRSWQWSSLLQTFLTGFVFILLAATVLVQAIRLNSIQDREQNHDPVSGDEDPHAFKHPDTINSTAGESGRCGFTAAEAVSRGCIFDYMNFAWQPPECYYPSMDVKFTNMMQTAENGSIRWWADEDLTQEIPDDPEVLKWYGEVWVERKYHYHHCTYGWALLHQSYNDGGPLPDLMTYNHSLHCAHVLKKAIKVDDGSELLLEKAVTWFSECVWPRRSG